MAEVIEPLLPGEVQIVLPDKMRGIGMALKITVTSAVLGVHVPLLMVQRKTYVPAASAVKVELPLPLALKLPVPPLTMLHTPVPVVGVLPPRAVLVSMPHRFWVEPAVAVVGAAVTVTLTACVPLQPLVFKTVSVPL